MFVDVQRDEACRRCFIERLSSRAMCTLSSDKPCCWGNMNVIELDWYVSLYHLWLVINWSSSGKYILWDIANFTGSGLKGIEWSYQIWIRQRHVVEHPSLANLQTTCWNLPQRLWRPFCTYFCLVQEIWQHFIWRTFQCQSWAWHGSASFLFCCCKTMDMSWSVHIQGCIVDI